MVGKSGFPGRIGERARQGLQKRLVILKFIYLKIQEISGDDLRGTKRR
jgi:hypothetical protein